MTIGIRGPLEDRQVSFRKDGSEEARTEVQAERQSEQQRRGQTNAAEYGNRLEEFDVNLDSECAGKCPSERSHCDLHSHFDDTLRATSVNDT